MEKAQNVPTHNWDRYDFGSGPTASDRLNQGPFGIDQDEGWYTVLVTSQSHKPVRNYGLGLVGYTMEEGGPSLDARQGRETLEQHVEKLSSLYKVDPQYLPTDEAGINVVEKTMLHVLDLGANYWSLWTESGNLAQYYQRHPNGFDTLRKRMGYRVRPSWVWQRKRYGTTELVVAFANDGVAGIPGVLRVYVESLDGELKIGGGLDAGHPYGGKLRQASFLLPRGIEGQQLKIRAEIETKGGIRRPVSWACAQPTNADGSLMILLIRSDDKRWRKSV